MSSNLTAVQGATTKTFTTALWVNSAVFAIELVGFTLLRTNFKAIYEPRTYLPTEKNRSESLPKRLLSWPLAIYRADYTLIKKHNGMDAYMFVRFLRMMVIVLLPIWLISWAILLPVTSVNASNGTTGKNGLDMFTFGNIPKTEQKRYAAHIILVWIFTFWIFYNINKEMHHFLTCRQRYLVDQVHSASAQANTVLVTGVPTHFLNERALTELFNHVPGGVRKIWLNRDLKELPELYDRRLNACNMLESAETSLLNAATKKHNKILKKQAKLAKKEKKGEVADGGNGSSDGLTRPDAVDAEKNADLLEKLVPQKKRPTHRLPLGFMPFSLPFIGKQVDTIEWAREEIVQTTQALERGRHIMREQAANDLPARNAKIGGIMRFVPRASTSGDDDAVAGYEAPKDGEDETYPPLNSAFILFNQQIGAHIAAQTLTHHAPYRMSEKFTEVAPEDVIWDNLGLNPYEKKIRVAISYALTAGLIILWAFPVAFVGIVSNIGQLCKTYSWLAWLCTIPGTVLGIIQGILPAVLLTVLMLLLPIILRIFARLEGIPRYTGLELSLMTRFFIFQVIHGFLIVTLASGIIAALPQLVKNPTSIPGLLAQQLPKASNFFLTFAVLQGLSGTAAGFLQIVPLVLYYVKLFILGSKPRSVYQIKYTMRNVAWGTLFPTITLLVVITLGYSIISPIINGLAWLTFAFFYLMYKYLFLYTFDQPPSGDTGGLFFPKAIQHVFVGLYVQQVCMAALFFLARDQNGNASSIPEGALMIVLLVFTAFFNIILSNSYGPLLHSLPLTLAHKSFGMPVSDEVGSVGDEDEEAYQDDDSVKREKQRQPQSSEIDRQGSAVEPASGTIQRIEENQIASESVPEGKQPIKTDFAEPVGIEGKHNDGPTDFYHPASVEAQRVIWLPKDTLGLWSGEERDIRALGIEVSTENARMDAKGHVDIDGRPPGAEVD